MNKPKRSWGQSLVEFALVIPVVVFAITVFLDLGRAVFGYTSLSNAVREGTRYAIVHPLESPADINAVIMMVKNSAEGLNPDNMNVIVTPPAAPDHYVTIQAAYQFSPVTPGLAMILGTGNNIILNASSKMEVAPLYQ